MKELLQSMGIATAVITLLLSIFMASAITAVVISITALVAFFYFIIKVKNSIDQKDDGPF